MRQDPPIAVIAGNGRLPLEIATVLRSRGSKVFVCGIEGEASPLLAEFDCEYLEWGQIGKMFKLLEKNKIEQVVFAGGIVGRPELSIRKMDWGAIKTLSGLFAALVAGDNEILSGVISVFEKRGLEVCNVAELIPELAADKGNNTSVRPKKADRERMEAGRTVIQALGEFDVGQACVVVGKRAVAIEGVEGTDGMISRIAELRKIGRLPRKPGGVLVKSIKTGQDLRADLPTIGPETVQGAYDAGLIGIGVLANKTLIVERERTLQLADELKLFIYGFEDLANG